MEGTSILIPVLIILTLRLAIVSGAILVKTQKNNHQNISNLLDNLLRGYDNSVRPDFGGKGLKIVYLYFNIKFKRNVSI